MTSPLGISDWPKSEDNKKPENLYGELLEFGLTNGNPMEIVEAGVKDERKIKLKSSIVPHAQEAGYDELLGMILEKLQDSLN
ncbi:MAG: hypothetical protein NTX66_00135, partial [Candidatus Falkowbacteria bacterium]|nr:hypothetical protein [Candidatus Falkowbacteria bacterium]